jgi:hypothetical protein
VPKIDYIKEVPKSVRQYVEEQQKWLPPIQKDLMMRLVSKGEHEIDTAWSLIQKHYPTKAGSFIFAAIAAYDDYTNARKEQREIGEILDSIARGANMLVSNIRALHEIQNYQIPYEFRRIEELLRAASVTRNKETMQEWERIKIKLLGQRFRPVDFKKENFREYIEYYWEVAPSLPDIFVALAKVAKESKPLHPNNNHTEAALSKDSHQPYTDYIRGLFKYLSMNGFENEVKTRRIIAATVNTIYGLDGTYDADSVDKALKKSPSSRTKKSAATKTKAKKV